LYWKSLPTEFFVPGYSYRLQFLYWKSLLTAFFVLEILTDRIFVPGLNILYWNIHTDFIICTGIFILTDFLVTHYFVTHSCYQIDDWTSLADTSEANKLLQSAASPTRCPLHWLSASLDSGNAADHRQSTKAWKSLRTLQTMSGGTFSKVVENIIQSSNQWRVWFECAEPENEKMPKPYNTKPAFHRLCILRALRPDRLVAATRGFVTNIDDHMHDMGERSLARIGKKVAVANRFIGNASTPAKEAAGGASGKNDTDPLRRNNFSLGPCFASPISMDLGEIFHDIGCIDSALQQQQADGGESTDSSRSRTPILHVVQPQLQPAVTRNVSYLPIASTPILFITPPNFVQDESANIQSLHEHQKTIVVNAAVCVAQILNRVLNLCESAVASSPSLNSQPSSQSLNVETLIEDASAAKTLHNISLSRGQSDVAEAAIEHCKAQGGWVILQNLHLVPLWLSKLQLMLQAPQHAPSKTARRKTQREGHAGLVDEFLRSTELQHVLAILNNSTSESAMQNCIANILLTSTKLVRDADGQAQLRVTHQCPWDTLVNKLVSFTLGFKMFLSMEMVAVSSHVDTALLSTGIFKNSYKVVNEARPTVQSSLGGCIQWVGKARLDDSSHDFKQNSYRRIIFALCFWHAINSSRHKFEPLGQRQGGGHHQQVFFSASDLLIGCNVVKKLLDDNEDQIPWMQLQTIVGEIVYGGHVSDLWTQRLHSCHLQYLFQQSLLEDDAFFMSPPVSELGFEGVSIPGRCSFDECQDFTTNLGGDSPLIYCLHPNAEIVASVKQGQQLSEDLRSLSFSSATERLPLWANVRDDHRLFEIIMNILDHLPQTIPKFLIDAFADDFQTRVSMQSSDDEVVSFLVDDVFCPFFFVQKGEIDRMNSILATIRNNLEGEVIPFLEGSSVHDTQLDDDFMHSLNLGLLPSKWARLFESSGDRDQQQQVLDMIDDLKNRHEQLQTWADMTLEAVRNKRSFLPVSLPEDFGEDASASPAIVVSLEECQLPFFWLPGLFYPSMLIGAIQQSTARKRKWPLDKVKIRSFITSYNESEMQDPPDDGIHISGVTLTGGRWDDSLLSVAESEPKQLRCTLPVIRVFGEFILEPDAETKSPWENNPRANGGVKSIREPTGDKEIAVIPVYRSAAMNKSVFLLEVPCAGLPEHWIMRNLQAYLEAAQ
jgi:hypothetical protein